MDCGKLNRRRKTVKSQEFDKNSWGWSWLERWMVARPWETRLMDATDSATPPPHTLSSSPGSSSICTSNTPASGTTGLVSDNSSSQANEYKPSYISMTESTKAKRRTNRVLLGNPWMSFSSGRVVLSWILSTLTPTKQRG
ncbi:hypothetical protein Bca4012_002907 [Brassica carinata]